MQGQSFRQRNQASRWDDLEHAGHLKSTLLRAFNMQI